MLDIPGSFIPFNTDIIDAMNKDENSVFIGVSFTFTNFQLKITYS
jgi:hypothetical protein